MSCSASGNVKAIDPRHNNVGIWLSVWIGRAQQFNGQAFGDVESPAFRRPHERMSRLASSPLRCRHVAVAVKFGLMASSRLAVENAAFLRPVIEANHADMNIRTGQNPMAVTFGKKNVARVFDALEHFAVCSAANPLCCQQSGALAFAVFNLLPGLFKPVAAKSASGGRACRRFAKSAST